jgi:glycosyltransferase involved in cell wall biosynthesis
VKIAMVSEHASPLSPLGGVDAGGQNVHVGALASHIAALGHRVEVYTRRTDTTAPDEVRFADRVVVRHVRAGDPVPISKDDLLPLMPEFSERLRRRWRLEPPDVIHSHFWMSGLAALDARPESVPLVHTYHALGVVRQRHQPDSSSAALVRDRIERRILEESDAIIATCNDEVRELLKIGGRGHHIDVVPCGVDVTMFHPYGAAKPRSSRRRAVCVSRLVPRKGIGDAIKALAAVPDTELIVIGGPAENELADDHEHRRLVNIARSWGVDDRVRFTGGLSQAEVAAWMRSADVIIAVPWYEPFGIVPVEAMACGKPVIGAAVGGLLDTVDPETTGVLVPPRSPEDVAKAMRRLLDDDALRAAMGRSAHIRARRDFPWRVVARRTVGTYERVCARSEALASSS